MDQQDEINRTLGKILGELKGMNRQFDSIHDTLRDHEDSINELKTYRDQQVGKLTIIGGVSGALLGFIGSWISSKLGM